MANHYSIAPMAPPNAPPGTFVPGTKIQVGNHRCVIERYLSEGGFAHVYVVKVATSGGGTETAVLKRVAVPDKDNLANMRTEVETMKKLKGHRHIVTYIDSHASQLKGGGYEVFLLMEFCEGGGLIDFMNTRLKDRLTEPEILKIFSDASEGLACMHYLKPPLLHRDLKVENILISHSGSTKYYKLCDFGSTAPPRPAATTAAEGRLIEDDVQRHTTLQYRSPEMVDVYRKRPIDEKSDIWALGVLLYKLCYYTTPFEEQGQMAILTASFKYPAFPPFSDRLKRLIATMLSEDPKKRPNIHQLLSEVCAMRGKQVPIKDIYADRSHSEARKNQQLPTPASDMKSPPLVGAVRQVPVQPKQVVPEVTPMRRGRPTATSRPPDDKPDASPGPKVDRDPFVALDSTSITVRTAAADELAARFPALDDFSLLQDKRSSFRFAPKPPPDTPKDKSITLALADEAFAQPIAKPQDAAVTARPSKPAVKPSSPELLTPSQRQQRQTVIVETLKVQTSQRPPMVSTGTNTSPPSSPKQLTVPPVSQRPIWRVPTPPSNGPSTSDTTQNKQHHRQSLHPPRRESRSAQSSRPSLENLRLSGHDQSDDQIHRSRSLDNRGATGAAAISSRDQRSREQDELHTIKPQHADADPILHDEEAVDDSNIESNVDFLRVMEEEGAGHRRKSSHGRSKHASMPSLSISSTRSKLAGKFGDAFRRFEVSGPGARATSPEAAVPDGSGRLTPATAPEDTGPPSLEGSAMDETEDLSPELRRELERRQVEMEEKRVTEAAASYRQQRLGGREGPPPIRKPSGSANRASAIQDRVKNLLDESGRASPVKRTAEGYGRFTDERPGSPAESQGSIIRAPIPIRAPTGRKPVAKPTLLASSAPPAVQVASNQGASQAGASDTVQPRGRIPSARPSAPPKPVALRTGAGGGGRNGAGPATSQPAARLDEGLDDLDDFSKRYPSLSLELVETEIESSFDTRRGDGIELRMRDV